MVTLKKNLGLGYYKGLANKGAPAFANTDGDRLRLLRKVSEDLNTNFSRDRSNEVRNDGQVAGSVITGASGGGTINLQLSLDTYDDLLASVLYAASDAGTDREEGWRQGLGVITDVQGPLAPTEVEFQVADNSFNRTTGSWARTPVAGERLYIRGFGNKNLDTIWTVAASPAPAAGKFVVVNDTGAADVAEYAGIAADVTAGAVTIQAVKGYTRNGTLERQLGFVRFYSDSDLAGTTSTTGLTACDWALFRGAIPTGIQLACAPGQAGWTGSIPVLFSDEATITDAATAPNIGGFQITNWNQMQVVNENPLPNAIQSVLMVKLRKVGAALTDATRVDPQSFNVNITNGATEVQATRNLGAVAIIGPTMGATTTLALLYIDPTYHQGMLNDDAYEVEIGVGDADGRAQLWRFPKNRYTSQRPNPGVQQPVINTLTFEAEPGGQGFVGGATAGRMIEILRFYLPAA